MPAKKQDLPPHLSEYLLKKAEPFEFYPKRIYGLVPDVRKIFSDLARELVDGRKTFQPRGDERQLHFFGQPVMLDQFYSKELLAAVPGFVERTQHLRALTFAGVADQEAVEYLRESATCYIHGLFQATAALARSAMELRLRKRVGAVAGSGVGSGLDLKELLQRYGDQVLSRQGVKLAAMVRVSVPIRASCLLLRVESRVVVEGNRISSDILLVRQKSGPGCLPRRDQQMQQVGMGSPW